MSQSIHLFPFCFDFRYSIEIWYDFNYSYSYGKYFFQKKGRRVGVI